MPRQRPVTRRRMQAHDLAWLDLMKLSMVTSFDVWITRFGSRAAAVQAYAQNRDRMIDASTPDRRPEVFWIVEGPPDLAYASLDSIDRDSDSFFDALEDLDDRRLEWLLKEGELNGR